MRNKNRQKLKSERIQTSQEKGPLQRSVCTWSWGRNLYTCLLKRENCQSWIREMRKFVSFCRYLAEPFPEWNFKYHTKAETKSNSLEKGTNKKSNEIDEKIKLLEKQLNFLREGCNFKNQLTNLLLETFLKIDIVSPSKKNDITNEY